MHNDNKKKNYSVNLNQSSSASLLKDIRRNTKQIFTSEQKVLIGKEDIRGEHSIAEVCCKYLYKKYNIKHIHANSCILRDARKDKTISQINEKCN